MTLYGLAELHLKAEQGDLPAQFHLGIAYTQQKNFVEAAKWYLKAAEQGHISAQHEMGLMYIHGHGVPEDHSEAERWLRKAEKQGSSDSTRLLKNLEYSCKVALKEQEKENENVSANKSERPTTIDAYKVGVRFFGVITALIVFIFSWIYCIITYGYLLGVGLGWLPSVIVAVISALFVGWFWPLILLGIPILFSYM